MHKVLRNKRNLSILFVLLIIILIVVMIISCTFGTANITFIDSLKIIGLKIPILNNILDGSNIPKGSMAIIYKLRIPRVIMACLAGMGLSVVGTVFQGLFRNPMADPFILGISSGASLGATLAIVSGLFIPFLGLPFISFVAFIGGMVTIIVVYSISLISGGTKSNTILLCGIAINSFCSSIVSLIMIIKYDKIENIVLWTMGSLSSSNMEKVYILLPLTIVSLIGICSLCKELNAMAIGEEQAKSFGINVELVRKILIFMSTLLCSVIISMTGVIGFVGLIVPHMVRLITGPDHRVLIPFSMVSGAIFLILCDTLSRTIANPTELPVGAITSLFGVPFFIFLLIKNRRGEA